MLHPDLKVNGKNVKDENEFDELLKSDHLTCEICDTSLEVEFSKDRAAFIGWINEYDGEVFYFDNGSGNDEPVDLIINICPEERMMCYDPNAVKKIVYCFCQTGERCSEYSWIQEEE